jgi:chromosome segregation ATPase
MADGYVNVIWKDEPQTALEELQSMRASVETQIDAYLRRLKQASDEIKEIHERIGKLRIKLMDIDRVLTLAKTT